MKSERAANAGIPPRSLYTDGCVLNNNLPHATKYAGWAVVRDGGEVLVSGAKPDLTSNEAELYALIRALEWALHHDAGGLTICTDSQAILWAVLDGRGCGGKALAPMVSTARGQFSRLNGRVVLRKIPRRLNQADREAGKQARLLQQDASFEGRLRGWDAHLLD